MTITIEDVPLIVRREIEARILAPFVEALAQRFGHEAVFATLQETIQNVARDQGRQAAASCGRNDLAAFERVKDRWQEGGDLELHVLPGDESGMAFDVTRCRYAEMYQRLGIPELGAILSCGRDAAASEGFNPDLELTRTHTILGGASHCDFRYRLRPEHPRSDNSAVTESKRPSDLAI